MLQEFHFRNAKRIACLLLFYVLATSQVTSGRVPTSDSLHALRLYGAAQLGNQAPCTMTRYILQLHYPNYVLISACPIIVMPNARLVSIWFESAGIRSPDRRCEKAALYRFDHGVR